MHAKSTTIIQTVSRYLLEISIKIYESYNHIIKRKVGKFSIIMFLLGQGPPWPWLTVKRRKVNGTPGAMVRSVPANVI